MLQKQVTLQLLNIVNSKCVILLALILFQIMFSILAGCRDSSECGDGAFCNFDNGNSGFCEHCPDLGGGRCEDAGFNTQKGEYECKARCEGW